MTDCYRYTAKADASSTTSDHKLSDTPADDAVVMRIRKILERGLHPNTPAAEAVNSMRLATNLMARHHLKQDEVMCHHPSGDTQLHELGALFVVQVTPLAPRKVTVKNAFGEQVSNAVCNMFGVQMFYMKKNNGRIDFTFYGRRLAARAAALEFEAAFNAGAHHAQCYVDRASSSTSVITSRNSCALGYASGLYDTVNELKGVRTIETPMDGAPAGDDDDMTRQQMIVYNEKNRLIAEAILEHMEIKVKTLKVVRKRSSDDQAFATGRDKGRKHEFAAGAHS